ncbi:MAG: hypothetical protein AB7P20_09415 [Rhizobiaceae bacterium]
MIKTDILGPPLSTPGLHLHRNLMSGSASLSPPVAHVFKSVISGIRERYLVHQGVNGFAHLTAESIVTAKIIECALKMEARRFQVALHRRAPVLPNERNG